jgi:hypothetical protein
MQQLMSKNFIDGGDAEETRTADKLLRTIRPEWQRGIDGQTHQSDPGRKEPRLLFGRDFSTLHVDALAPHQKVVGDEYPVCYIHILQTKEVTIASNFCVITYSLSSVTYSTTV